VGTYAKYDGDKEMLIISKKEIKLPFFISKKEIKL
jgi:hypothetical protein